MKKILAQGAEAVIYLKDNKVIKKRIKKSYRISFLDEKIRKQRTKREIKLLKKAQEIIPVPEVIKEGKNKKEIQMEFLDGLKLSENLNKFPIKRQKEILKEIGEKVSKLHSKDIIHGDLTTSNMILKDEQIYFIDFGLGFISPKYEDKAVDIHVLKEALEARHFENWKSLFSEFERAYKKTKEAKKVFERLKKVERRGRYKKKI
ncbi:Kae1-associated kinase Bud32 [Candidatus Pacearchaeota archaeon]|nr:MAG: Kae1-associated kinase Bud32 [Candidatus Pacearchaeota archaeon]